MYSAERIIFLDNVDYKKGYFHNKTVLLQHKNSSTIRIDLRVPVQKGATTRIDDTKLDKRFPLAKLQRTIAHLYSDAPYFDETWPNIERSLSDTYASLFDLNVATLNSIWRCLFGQDIKFSRASTYYDGSNATDRLVAICQANNANKILVGWGGSMRSDVHDLPKLASKGIVLVQPDESIAKELKPQDWRLGVSVLDDLFINGSENVVSKLSAWRAAYAQGTSNFSD